MTIPDPVLLVSLGKSAAIVPEAFLFEGIRFHGVHVLSSESTDFEPVRAFFSDEAPEVELTLTRVAGFSELRSEEDHHRFDEVLLRWFLDRAPDPRARYVCLAGGFKTMSSAMQRAAFLLGAAEVFHVLADPLPGMSGKSPSSRSEIVGAARSGRIHWIKLGAEAGWPQLRNVSPQDYPLVSQEESSGFRRVVAPNRALGERIQAMLDRSHRIAHRWSRLADLPFPELAAWSEACLDWLEQPLDPDSDQDRTWVARLPKVELHCHLGGFATSGDLLAEVRGSAECGPPPDLVQESIKAGWPLPSERVSLEEYRRLGANNGSRLLRDPGCLRRQCEALYRELCGQRVLYAEIRCSPANYADPSLDRSP